MNHSKALWHPLARQAVGSANFIKTGDDYVKFGEPPWISEMYGYMFGAAEQGVDTTLTRGVVQYTDAGNARPHPSGPAIIHYGQG